MPSNKGSDNDVQEIIGKRTTFSRAATAYKHSGLQPLRAFRAGNTSLPLWGQNRNSATAGAPLA